MTSTVEAKHLQVNTTMGEVLTDPTMTWQPWKTMLLIMRAMETSTLSYINVWLNNITYLQKKSTTHNKYDTKYTYWKLLLFHAWPCYLNYILAASVFWTQLFIIYGNSLNTMVLLLIEHLFLLEYFFHKDANCTNKLKEKFSDKFPHCNTIFRIIKKLH